MKNNMKYLAIFTLSLVLLMPQNVKAQNENLGPLLSVTELVIKPGHEMQFREGIKAWMGCYSKNNGDWTWRLWQRQQGEGTVFVLASEMANWAEMDKSDESGASCQDLGRTLINPHIEKATNHITRLQPGISKNALLTEDIIRVSFYSLNNANGHKMMEVVKEVEAIRKQANLEPNGYWYQWQTADPGSPSYHHVMPYKDFAAMDIMLEGVWQTVEKQAGKAKKDELQAAFRSSLELSWNYIYKLDKEISRLNK